MFTTGRSHCLNCGARTEHGDRLCPACFTALDDGGSTQAVLFIGWFPAGVVAAIAGVVVALAEWNLWALPVVLVVGTLLGWLATVVVFFGLLEFHAHHHLGAGVAEGLFLSTCLLVGPLVACAVAACWPCSLAIVGGVCLLLMVALLAWYVVRLYRRHR
jgi:hypothetical protein